MKLSDHGTVLRTREVFEVRSMTRDDLAVLHEPRVAMPAIQRLRDPHHRLARMLALGIRTPVAAARAGYSAGRVSTLLADPAFRDLVAKYQANLDGTLAEAEDDYIELATGNMLKAERMLAEKLEEADENEEFLPTRDLIAISRDAADRLGYGKKSLTINANVDFAARLERTIHRSDQARVIDNSPPSPGRSTPTGNSGALSPQPLIRRRA